MACDECGSNSLVQSYTFQYGNKAGSKQEGAYKRVSVRVGGQKTVYLCSKCIGKYRRNESIKGLVLVGIAVTLIIASQQFNTTASNELGDFMGIAGLLGGLWAGSNYWSAFVGNTYDLGISRAIARHKPDLMKQGYDYFVWDKKK